MMRAFQEMIDLFVAEIRPAAPSTTGPAAILNDLARPVHP